MRFMTIGAALLTMATGLAAAPAYAESCQQLWVERNQMYKNHGYCFKTQRAIDHFGNGGCHIHNDGDVPFTRAERTRIEHIQQEERQQHCPA